MVEAQGVRGFRKSLDHSCRLDPLIVSHHNSLDAACCSGKRNPGKAVPALPCFSCSSWAPPRQALTFRQRLYLCTPCQAQGSDSTPKSRRRRDTCRRTQTRDVPWSNAAMRARKAAGGFIPPPGRRFCAPLPATAGEVLRRASPDLPWQRLAAGVFRSRSQRACAEQSVPHFYTCREKEKKADILETQIFLYLSWYWQ